VALGDAHPLGLNPVAGYVSLTTRCVRGFNATKWPAGPRALLLPDDYGPIRKFDQIVAKRGAVEPIISRDWISEPYALSCFRDSVSRPWISHSPCVPSRQGVSKGPCSEGRTSISYDLVLGHLYSHELGGCLVGRTPGTIPREVTRPVRGPLVFVITSMRLRGQPQRFLAGTFGKS